MKERPILFSTEMVQAILDGRKTQTRRVLNPQLPFHKFDFFCGNNDAGYSALTTKGYVEFRGYEIFENGERKYTPFYIKPKYGEKNDILWVRETWVKLNGQYVYKADYDNGVPANEIELPNGATVDDAKWKPSIHMPKEACRLRLKIKSIRVERLMDISEQDAIAEGVRQRFGGFINYANPSNLFTETYPFLGRKYSAAQMSYLSLWERINGENSFEENPWVWVIEFERA